MSSSRKRTLQIDILMDPTGLNRGVGQAEAATGRLSGSMSNLGGQIRSVVAAAGFVTLGRQAVDAAMDAGEAASAFNTTFGSAAARAGLFVEQFANQAGFASYQLQQMMAVTGNVVQGLGATEEESLALSQRMVTLSGDVASFINAEGGAQAVMLAMQSAINGEREALKTYGLAISEAEVQQKAFEMTGKTSEDQLTRMDKALATVELAYQKAGKAVGDLERTQESDANQARAARAEFQELLVTVGQKLVPAVAAGTAVLKDAAAGVQLIVEWFGRLPDPAKKAIAAIGGISTALYLMVAHPAIAALGIVTGAIAALGNSAAEHQAQVEGFRQVLLDFGKVDIPNLLDMIPAEVLIRLQKAGIGIGQVHTAITGTKDQWMDFVRSLSDAGYIEDAFDVAPFLSLYDSYQQAVEEADAFTKAEEEQRDMEQSLWVMHRRLELSHGGLQGAQRQSARTAEEWKTALQQARQAVIDAANAQIAAASPTLQLLAARKQQTEAESRYKEVLGDSEATEQERIDASIALVEAQGRVEGAEAQFYGQHTATVEAFRKLAENAGLYGDELERIWTYLLEINRVPKPEPDDDQVPL